MIPADVDPSLRSGEAAPETLDDGFSPPPGREPQQQAAVPPDAPETALTSKSPF